MVENKRSAAYLQVTRKCNNECIFCSNPQFEQESSLEELKEQVLNFRKQGVSEIILTGGEPTISEHICEIIKFIKTTGLDMRMITNGVELSDSSLAKNLKEAGLKDINVSIHHFDEAAADSLSQKKGHWKKAMDGIKNALNQGINITINSTINSKNAGELSGFVEFMTSKFPEINHYVFNNLDPGNADGIHKSRAGQHPEVIARLVEFEIELSKAVGVLKEKGKTFRVERVPLCYMDGFEEFSTETRKIAKDEKYTCAFLRSDKSYETRTVSADARRTKAECCSHCMLNCICAGLQNEYVDLHGITEVYPVFKSADKIKNKILEDSK